jgi:hypothetical protein
MKKVAFEFDPLAELGIELPRNRRKEAREAIAEFVKESVLSQVGDGKSPVQNGPWKRSLSPEYKKRKGEESSANYANLELTGALLDALDVKVDGTRLVLQVAGSEAGKAEGSNIGSYGKGPDEGKARRFIPLEGETFTPAIWQGIRQILEEFKDGED